MSRSSVPCRRSVDCGMLPSTFDNSFSHPPVECQGLSCAARSSGMFTIEEWDSTWRPIRQPHTLRILTRSSPDRRASRRGGVKESHFDAHMENITYCTADDKRSTLIWGCLCTPHCA